MSETTELAAVEPQQSIAKIDYGIDDKRIEAMKAEYGALAADSPAALKAIVHAIANCRTTRTGLDARKRELNAAANEHIRAVNKEYSRIYAAIQEIENDLKARKEQYEKVKAEEKAKRDSERRAAEQAELARLSREAEAKVMAEAEAKVNAAIAQVEKFRRQSEAQVEAAREQARLAAEEAEQARLAAAREMEAIRLDRARLDEERTRLNAQAATVQAEADRIERARKAEEEAARAAEEQARLAAEEAERQKTLAEYVERTAADREHLKGRSVQLQFIKAKIDSDIDNGIFTTPEGKLMASGIAGSLMDLSDRIERF